LHSKKYLEIRIHNPKKQTTQKQQGKFFALKRQKYGYGNLGYD